MRRVTEICTCDLCGLPIKGATAAPVLELDAVDRRGRVWKVGVKVMRSGHPVDPDLHPACQRAVLRGLQRKTVNPYVRARKDQAAEATAVKRALKIGGALPKQASAGDDDDDY